MIRCDLLRQKRKECKFKQAYVARYLGFGSKNGYWSIERGRTKLTAENLAKLAQLYNVPADYFLSETMPGV